MQLSSLNLAPKNDIMDKTHLLSKFETLSGSAFNEKVLINNRPTLIMFFDPDCHDCDIMTKRILKYYSEFSSLNILMISEAEIANVNEFVKNYNLSKFSNITILLDREEIMYKDYGINSVPSFVLYNSDLKLEQIITEPFDFITLVLHVRKANN